MKAEADVIVVLSHLGFADGGYGYGIPVYGDQTLATKLNTAGKPANLIIGGHSHSNLTAATMVGNTAVVQAYYNGRTVGRADGVEQNHRIHRWGGRSYHQSADHQLCHRARLCGPRQYAYRLLGG
jgi:2',3'-cyclic-nucleotide 2'-phosphodiesterase (5'-nucleotidase family)